MIDGKMVGEKKELNETCRQSDKLLHQDGDRERRRRRMNNKKERMLNNVVLKIKKKRNKKSEKTSEILCSMW